MKNCPNHTSLKWLTIIKKKYHTVGTVSKCNRKIVEKRNIDIPKTQNQLLVTPITICKAK
jgi:hypothetical protein